MMTAMRLISILCSIATLSIISSTVQTRYVRLAEKPAVICERFLNITSCYYFACLDAIYQCGRGNILVQFSYRFCEGTLELTHQSLTRSGQAWARAAQACIMRTLHDLLRSNPSSTCTDIDRHVLQEYPVCLTESHPVYSICSVICNNLQVFLDIFNDWNLPNVNLKGLLVDASHLCQEQSQMDHVIDVSHSDLRTILWSLCLDSYKTQLQDFQPNELMIEVSQRSGLFADFRGEEY